MNTPIDAAAPDTRGNATPTRTYLPQSVDRFLTPDQLSALMVKVGLRDVRFRRLGMRTVTVHTGVV